MGDGCAGDDGDYGTEGFAECVEYYLAGACATYHLYVHLLALLLIRQTLSLLTFLIVSEPIGLEIVAFNGGSYTGAILFTGWMYIGAAVFLWLVRAWKIGEDEEMVAVAARKAREDAVGTGTDEDDFERSAFLKRMFMVRKV